jgi:site-specific recombinase XerD
MDLSYLMKKEMFRRKYSSKTIKIYVFCLNQFLKKCHKEPRKITKADVKTHLESLCGRNKSASTLNVHLQAIKFALEEILNKRFFVKLPYSKVPQKMPEVLTKEEVRQLFEAITNTKHQLMIKLLYSAGLRVSELIHLKVKDLQLDKNYGWVRQGKGSKDRPFIMAEALKGELADYIKKEGLEQSSWLFKGRQKYHITTRTIQQITKKATKEAGISKRVHPHTLRHSFATHMIEDGYDVALIQSLLGHNSSETTMTYVHITSPRMINAKSPYDGL